MILWEEGEKGPLASIFASPLDTCLAQLCIIDVSNRDGHAGGRKKEALYACTLEISGGSTSYADLNPAGGPTGCADFSRADDDQPVRYTTLGMLAAAAVSLFLALSAATTIARAETKTFGGNPAGEVDTQIDCEDGAPPFHGAQTCQWAWRGPSGGDGVPFPELTGGSGTVTAVTLPAMANPGPMEAVVETGTLIGSSEPGITSYDCCQIDEISPQFTVPADKETTVTLDLAVSSTPTGNFAAGETASYDGLAIVVLSPTASLPLHYTGNETIGDEDADKAYFPAPPLSKEYDTPTDPAGYELMAKFTLETGVATPVVAPPPAPAPAPAPAAPAPPNGGLKLGGGTLSTANLAGPLTLGQAQNPPTAFTTQTLTVPGAAAARKKKSKPKPIVIGKGATTVPAGKTVSITLTLTSAGRKLLGKKHTLKVTETIVTKNSAGQTQTTTRTVTIRLEPKSHKRK
jgi:hypothetical protein